MAQFPSDGKAAAGGRYLRSVTRAFRRSNSAGAKVRITAMVRLVLPTNTSRWGWRAARTMARATFWAG